MERIEVRDCEIEGLEPRAFAGVAYRPDPDAISHAQPAPAPPQGSGDNASAAAGPAGAAPPGQATPVGGELRLVGCNVTALPPDMSRGTNVATVTVEECTLQVRVRRAGCKHTGFENTRTHTHHMHIHTLPHTQAGQ